MPLGTGSSAGDGASPDWQQVQTLGVADVVMTILKARKTMPLATAAAVSRTRHGDGYRVLVSLLEGQPSVDAADLGGRVDGATALTPGQRRSIPPAPEPGGYWPDEVTTERGTLRRPTAWACCPMISRSSMTRPTVARGISA